MKLKLFAALGLFLVACSTQAANVSIADITIAPGTASVDVPLLISSDPAEMVGAMNISFAAGQPADAIAILNTGDEFDGTIWQGYTFPPISVAGTPSVHNAFSGAALINFGGGGTPEVEANGTIITYQLDTSGLAAGVYELNPNFANLTEARDASLADLTLAFSGGTLTVIPEPSTVVLTAIFGVLGLGVYIKRRRG